MVLKEALKHLGLRVRGRKDTLANLVFLNGRHVNAAKLIEGR